MYSNVGNFCAPQTPWLCSGHDLNQFGAREAEGGRLTTCSGTTTHRDQGEWSGHLPRRLSRIQPKKLPQCCVMTNDNAYKTNASEGIVRPPDKQPAPSRLRRGLRRGRCASAHDRRLEQDLSTGGTHLSSEEHP